MRWQTHSPDIETDSLQTQTYSQHLAAKQEHVPAKETQTDPHNVAGFELIFALITKVCIPENYMVSLPNGHSRGREKTPISAGAAEGTTWSARNAPCSSKQEVNWEVAASVTKFGRLTS